MATRMIFSGIGRDWGCAWAVPPKENAMVAENIALIVSGIIDFLLNSGVKVLSFPV